MKQNFHNLIDFYIIKEKFWLDCFAETGNEVFFNRSLKYKKRILVLQSFAGGTLTECSLKQINNLQDHAHVSEERQLNLF